MRLQNRFYTTPQKSAVSISILLAFLIFTKTNLQEQTNFENPYQEYTPKSKAGKWFNDRLPLLTLGAHLTDYPTPKNLNYWWTFGGILTFCLLTQIITGIVLAMHYVAHADLAFASVEHIMRNVNYGWLIRYIHSNGASMFF